MEQIRFDRVRAGDAPAVAVMAGELLAEIGAAIGGASAFDFDLPTASATLANFVAQEKSFVFVARGDGSTDLGFLALYESHAVYAGGVFGTISELYVRPAARSQGVGRGLIDAAQAFAHTRGWKRLEVTTPPLPAFERTLDFYRGLGFEISGGRKLKTTL